LTMHESQCRSELTLEASRMLIESFLVKGLYSVVIAFELFGNEDDTGFAELDFIIY